MIEPEVDARWALALQAAQLLAVDPFGLGGAVLRGPASDARDSWVAAFRAALPTATPWRRLPPRTADGRLIGGLDLAATLAAGRPIAERGLLAEVSGGVLVIPMAERLGAATGVVGLALDTGEVVVERDGLTLRAQARFTAILLDEGIGDERAPAALTERLAFSIDAEGLRAVERKGEPLVADFAGARARLRGVCVDDAAIEALATAGLAFGVPSLRVTTLALRAAKAAAALAGRDAVESDDVVLAAALVLAPRATTLPASDTDEADDAETRTPEDRVPPNDADSQSDRADAPDDDGGDPRDLTDLVVDATRAAIPAGLLATLAGVTGVANRQAAVGRAGALCRSGRRGRPAGTRRGLPGHGTRLAVVETLRAAAPWQTIRRAARDRAADPDRPCRILVRKDDFRITRYHEKSETVTIFVVDASGSAALHRLAEVKGAVELVLAECYVRRDSVALIAFRGEGAETILPPTRALARARRALAGQAGGGGTPLAAAIEAATLLADGARRKGQIPLCVFLTDGKANIGFERRRGRAVADADALAAARAFRAVRCAGLVLDIAPRPGASALRIAEAMGVRYQPLPHADAADLSRIVVDASRAMPQQLAPA